MSSTSSKSKTLAALAGLVAVTVFSCSKNEGTGASPSGSHSGGGAAATPSTMAATSTASTPAPSASANLTPNPNCPKGTSGPGTFDHPCEAKGASNRMMEVAWNSKTDEKGPHFKVTNKAPQPVLYGKIAVYFYDKAGKQLEVKDSGGKTHPFRICGGNIFSGVMKAGEKAVLTFSCVKKEDIPEGTHAIEGEMQMVGFADSTEKKNDLYWNNEDLVPAARKKGAK